jgi:hypothetical protein
MIELDPFGVMLLLLLLAVYLATAPRVWRKH